MIGYTFPNGIESPGGAGHAPGMSQQEVFPVAIPNHTPELRPIPDFPGYFADATGNIWSTRSKRKIKPFKLVPYQRITGHATVTVFQGSKQKTMNVHRLVALAWIGDGGGLPMVRHLDGDPRNNVVSNLAWGTSKDNMEDARRHGTLLTGDRAPARRFPERVARGDRNGARLHPERMPRGERNGLAKLTAERVREIRRLHAEGCATTRELARRFGVTPTNVQQVVKRKTWRHVE